MDSLRGRSNLFHVAPVLLGRIAYGEDLASKDCGKC